MDTAAGGNWVWTVLSNVDWSEPWLLGLLCFHLAVSLVILWTRRWVYVQAALLAALALVCFAAERINQWAADNYRSFSREQYFDSQGLFLSLLLSLPIILNSLLIVTCWFYQVWHLLVGVATLKERQRVSQKQKKRD